MYFFVSVFVTTPVKMRHINSHPILFSQKWLEHVMSENGGTPLEIAELLTSLDVFEGIRTENVQVMKEKTLIGSGKASFATVLCFAHDFDDSARKHILTAGLSGFLDSKSPDFVNLLVRAGYETFRSFCKELASSQVFRHFRVLDSSLKITHPR